MPALTRSYCSTFTGAPTLLDTEEDVLFDYGGGPVDTLSDSIPDSAAAFRTTSAVSNLRLEDNVQSVSEASGTPRARLLHCSCSVGTPPRVPGPR